MPHSQKAFSTILVFILISVISLSIITILFLSTDSPIVTANPTPTTKPELFISPAPSPKTIENPYINDPFFDMTIPYLRNREYSSELGSRAKFSENPNYTAYTTSYDSDGYRVDGYLTIPKGREPSGGWPAVVFVHGYIPPTVYEKTKNYTSYVDYLARNGFVVYKIDLRGHDESEGEAFGAYFSGDYIVDTLNARGALAASDFVNSDKIGLWGHSMAGNVTFRSMVAAKDIPAVVIWSGAVYTYSDMSEYGIQDNSYRPPTDDSERRKRREQLNEAHGSFDPDSEFWQQVAPTNFLFGVNGSMQIHHPVDDNVVSVEYSRGLVSELEGSEISIDLVEYQTGGHNIVSPSYERAMQSTVEFFEKIL